MRTEAKIQCGACGQMTNKWIYRLGLDLCVCPSCNETPELGPRLVDALVSDWWASHEKKTAKGILVFIYKSAKETDSTNGGISSKANMAVLTGSGIPELMEPTDTIPELRLVRRIVLGEPYMHCEPVACKLPGYRGWMFGGNYVSTSDSRFPNHYPIPIHDRQESPELFASLSN